MPLIEVEEGELAKAKGAQALMESLGKNPKTRQHLLGLVKLANPDAAIPEVDVPLALGRHVDERIEGLEKRLSETLGKLEEREATREVNETISAARRRLRRDGYSAEAIGEIEKLMQERGVADYDAAAALWDRQQPAPEPVVPDSGYVGSAWGFTNPNADDTLHNALLKRDYKTFVDGSAKAALAEVRGQGGQPSRRTA